MIVSIWPERVHEASSAFLNNYRPNITLYSSYIAMFGIAPTIILMSVISAFTLNRHVPFNTFCVFIEIICMVWYVTSLMGAFKQVHDSALDKRKGLVTILRRALSLKIVDFKTKSDRNAYEEKLRQQNATGQA